MTCGQKLISQNQNALHIMFEEKIGNAEHKLCVAVLSLKLIKKGRQTYFDKGNVVGLLSKKCADYTKR